jgi:hypothetical protein
VGTLCAWASRPCAASAWAPPPLRTLRNFTIAPVGSQTSPTRKEGERWPARALGERRRQAQLPPAPALRPPAFLRLFAHVGGVRWGEGVQWTRTEPRCHAPLAEWFMHAPRRTACAGRSPAWRRRRRNTGRAAVAGSDRYGGEDDASKPAWAAGAGGGGGALLIAATGARGAAGRGRAAVNPCGAAARRPRPASQPMGPGGGAPRFTGSSDCPRAAAWFLVAVERRRRPRSARLL